MTVVAEDLSREDIDLIVDRKVRATTRLGYDHNEFIHDLFKHAGINPHIDISGRQDLVKAARKGVRTKGADISRCYTDYIERIPTLEVWSSGTSGIFKKILRSPDEIERINKGQDKVYASSGMLDGQRIITFTGSPPYGSNQSTPDALKKMNVRHLNMTIPEALRYFSGEERARLAKTFIDIFEEFNPDCVRSGTWQVSWLPRFLQPYGFDKTKLSVRKVIFSGDPTSLEERKSIGFRWDAEPFEIYSSTEVSVISYECKSHMGLHLEETGVLTTAIDPENGEEVAQDEVGLDMVTPLFDENALPATILMNYSHGDNIKMLSVKCNCNQRFALMDHPTRKTKKMPIAAFDFEPKVKRSLFRRAVRRAIRILH